MTVCNCTGGCNCCKNWFKPTYGVPVQPVYRPYTQDEEPSKVFRDGNTGRKIMRLDDTETIQRIELKLTEHSLLIDSLQSNLEKLHESIDRIEKALDSICG